MFFRVCQEAVNNACKYSGSNVPDVSLEEKEGNLTLEAADHGVGFDPEHVQAHGSGMGLLGMADRAELIDGELTYQSAPGRERDCHCLPDLRGFSGDESHYAYHA